MRGAGDVQVGAAPHQPPGVGQQRSQHRLAVLLPGFHEQYVPVGERVEVDDGDPAAAVAAVDVLGVPAGE